MDEKWPELKIQTITNVPTSLDITVTFMFESTQKIQKIAILSITQAQSSSTFLKYFGQNPWPNPDKNYKLAYFQGNNYYYEGGK